MPIYLDPFFVGVLLSVVGAIVGTIAAPKTEAEDAEQRKLFVSSENIGNMKKYGYAYIVFAIIFTVAMIAGYAIPYLRAISQ